MTPYSTHLTNVKKIEKRVVKKTVPKRVVKRVLKKDVVVNEKQFFSVKVPESCSIREQNRYVYNVLHDSYLWSDRVLTDASLIETSTSPRDLLESLRDEGDHFSYIMDLSKADTFFGEGRYTNYGFIPFLITQENQKLALVVAFIYPNSPANRAGMRRGDIITHLDGKEISEGNIESLYRLLKKSHSVKFTLVKNGKRYTKTLSKYSYKVKTVSKSHIYLLKDRKVGYLLLSDFIKCSTAELDGLFRKFKERNISELILDLRYNGGGDVRIANHLASLIGGYNTANKVSEYMYFNDKYSNLNKTTYFESYNPEQLNLKRLFVLTSARTCSASERVIHNLKASATNMEIIQIGKKTCGKPYGYEGVGVFCNKVLFAINTSSTNSDEHELYTDGIEPTCDVDDDMFRSLGDKDEAMLKEALYYVKHDRCIGAKSEVVESKSFRYKIINFISEALGF